MESKQVISALEALAQEHRLAVFRSLVQAGPAGLTPSRISEALGIPAPTLSFHLAQLKHAGLVKVTREGRSLIYAAAYETMNGVIAFLTENCCAGEACASSMAVACAPKGRDKPQSAATRPRRRA